MLDTIVKKKRMRIEEEYAGITAHRLEKLMDELILPCVRDFEGALCALSGIAIIGEIKKASPSKGIIRKDFDPPSLAADYESAEVNAISVLTERDFFLGEDEYIPIIRRSCDLPLLRKDFIIDLRQIYQSRILGADAILLIAGLLDPLSLNLFHHTARCIGLHCLVEVHSQSEIDSALEAKASIIGINNRNLSDFSVSIKTTEQLIRFIPDKATVVSESGIDASNAGLLSGMGVDAILVGEAFMRQNDIIDGVRKMRRAINAQG